MFGLLINNSPILMQGCQMVYFQTKNTKLGQVWSVGKFYGHLMYFVVILVYSAKEKSGNPVQINSF
jgi:hypothetical protein